MDNQAVIFLTVNPAVEQQIKHIDICHHYICEQYENKVIEPYHIPGDDNPADLFTKSLAVIKVEKFRAMIGLTWKFIWVGVLKQKQVGLHSD